MSQSNTNSTHKTIVCSVCENTEAWPKGTTSRFKAVYRGTVIICLILYLAFLLPLGDLALRSGQGTSDPSVWPGYTSSTLVLCTFGFRGDLGH